jgi:hypothetical protein
MKAGTFVGDSKSRWTQLPVCIGSSVRLISLCKTSFASITIYRSPLIHGGQFFFFLVSNISSGMRLRMAIRDAMRCKCTARGAAEQKNRRPITDAINGRAPTCLGWEPCSLPVRQSLWPPPSPFCVLAMQTEMKKGKKPFKPPHATRAWSNMAWRR